MKKLFLRYGGEINTGDFIAVTKHNSLSFGWFVQEGRGTIQYYFLYSISDQRKLWKDYVYKDQSRIMKINNPEEVLTGADLIQYEQAVKILKEKNFLR